MSVYLLRKPSFPCSGKHREYSDKEKQSTCLWGVQCLCKDIQKIIMNHDRDVYRAI